MVIFDHKEANAFNHCLHAIIQMYLFMTKQSIFTANIGISLKIGHKFNAYYVII